MLTNEEMFDAANELLSLSSTENDGRGIVCVRAIVKHMVHGDEGLARMVRRTEGDLTRQYPKVEAALYKIFGCRLHSVQGCREWLCCSV